MGVETGLATEGVTDAAAIRVCAGVGGGKASWLSGMQPAAIRTGSAATKTKSLRIQVKFPIAAERLGNIVNPMGL